MAGGQTTVTIKMTPAQFRAHAEAVRIAHQVARRARDMHRARADVTPLLLAAGFEHARDAVRWLTEFGELDTDFDYGLGLQSAM